MIEPAQRQLARYHRSVRLVDAEREQYRDDESECSRDGDDSGDETAVVWLYGCSHD